MDGIEELEGQVTALETTLGSVSGMVGTFEGELSRMRETMTFTGREAERLSNNVGGGVRRAFDGLIFDGERLSDSMRNLGLSISQAIYKTAMKPMEGAIGSLLSNGLGALMGGAMPFAKGGAFTQGRVMPFAKGGVVSSPVTFPMRGATGLMGEAGPEAIMPLTRGADGRLGVQAQGGGRPVNIVMNVSSPDVQGFQRSQAQIAAQMSRALSRGQRNR
ncbi:phage tail tape measure protein [Falsirhodobacter halotolerans]|uniref:phage tail tape measure protein n=1 Tax=Falsirhodobacter halotolerans TaxID=1146892 RepID=UPI001FD4B12D|nr:phage tail tape measure protein [Falsirhodobacter halotolerans]MCJ8139304.1 phage tail tape measure protein [Falsirhodobacter halotolerans]